MRYSFILLSILIPFSYNSQKLTSPGRVSGVSLWVKNDINEGKTRVKDYSIYNQNVEIINFPKEEMLNFNPVLKFDDSYFATDFLKIYKNTGFSNSTTIGVFQSEKKNEDKDILDIQRNSQSEMIVTTDIIKKYNGENDLDYGKNRGQDFIENAKTGDFIKPKIIAYSRQSQPSYSVWGSRSNPHTILFSNSKSINDNSGKFKGLFGELLTYDRTLTEFERLRVESYLAIKYGVHLVGDYLDSDGNIIWNSSKNKDFHRRVSGIGKDENSGLYQMKTTSSYENPKGFLTLSLNRYKKSTTCNDCIEYKIENAKNINVNGNTIECVPSSAFSWSKDPGGGFINIPFNTSGTAVDFEYNSAGRAEQILGLSYRESGFDINEVDYGLLRTTRGELKWCKTGNCEDLNIKHDSQKFKIALDNSSIVLYIDGKAIKTESAPGRPLYVDFVLTNNLIPGKIENLIIHNPTPNRDFTDKEFYVWGDNNGSLKPSDKSGIAGLTVLDRKWKMQSSNTKTNSTKLLTTVDIDFSRLQDSFPYSKEYNYYLIKNTSGNSDFTKVEDVKFYPANVFVLQNGLRFYAHEVDWAENENGEVFTIGYSSSFLASVKVENPLCSDGTGKIDVSLITGKQSVPIEYDLLKGRESIKKGSITNGDEVLTIDNLLKGEYLLRLKSNDNRISEYKVSLVAPEPVKLDVPKKINITHSGEIVLDASKGQKEGYNIYEWSGPNNFQFTGPKATLKEPGTYTVTAKFGESCSVSESIEVLKSNIADIKYYPVPVKAGELLTVNIQLIKSESVKIQIFDMSGHEVFSKERNVLSTQHVFNVQLMNIGNYKVVVSTPGSVEKFGIIVN